MHSLENKVSYQTDSDVSSTYIYVTQNKNEKQKKNVPEVLLRCSNIIT